MSTRWETCGIASAMPTAKLGALVLCCIINISNSTIWLYTSQQIVLHSHKLVAEGAATNSWAEVYLHAGAAVGCFVSWVPICYLGHKITLQVFSAVLQVAGTCLVFVFFWIHSMYLLVSGTCLVGAAVGLCFVAVPVTVLDITSPQCSVLKRSVNPSMTVMIFSTQLPPAVGNLVTTVFPTSLGTPFYLVPLCGTFISVLGFCFVTDSPKQLFIFSREHKENMHCKVITRDSYRQSEESANTGILRKLITFLRALCLAACLLCLSDFAGMELCNFYSDWVLKFAGLDTQAFPSSQLRNVFLRLSLVTFTLGLMAYCKSRWIEGICLIFSSALVSLSLFSIGLCLFGLEQGENWTWAVPWIPFSAFLTFQVAFWIGIGTLAQVATFTYTAPSLRPLVLSLGGSLHFVMQAVEKSLLIRMIDALHPFGTFWFYAGTSAIGLVLIVFLIVPEIYRLKGEEIIMLQNDSNGEHIRPCSERQEEIPMTEI